MYLAEDAGDEDPVGVGRALWAVWDHVRSCDDDDDGGRRGQAREGGGEGRAGSEAGALGCVYEEGGEAWVGGG